MSNLRVVAPFTLIVNVEMTLDLRLSCLACCTTGLEFNVLFSKCIFSRCVGVAPPTAQTYIDVKLRVKLRQNSTGSTSSD